MFQYVQDSYVMSIFQRQVRNTINHSNGLSTRCQISVYRTECLKFSNAITNTWIAVYNSPSASWCWRRLLRVPWTARSSNQSMLIFMAKTDAKAKDPILWPSNVKSWLTEKDPDAGKDWRQEEKKVAEWESQVLGRLIRSPESRRRKEDSGALEEETQVWNSQGGGKNKGPSFISTFLSRSHTKWFFL